MPSLLDGSMNESKAAFCALRACWIPDSHNACSSGVTRASRCTTGSATKPTMPMAGNALPAMSRCPFALEKMRCDDLSAPGYPLFQTSHQNSAPAFQSRGLPDAIEFPILRLRPGNLPAVRQGALEASASTGKKQAFDSPCLETNRMPDCLAERVGLTCTCGAASPTGRYAAALAV